MNATCSACKEPLGFTGATRFTNRTEYEVACGTCHNKHWAFISSNGPRTVLAFGATWMIFCPACKCMHRLNQDWKFEGDVEKPSFSPSLLVDYGDAKCHSFIKHGKIEFCRDSTHKLAGKIVELPAIDEMVSRSCLRKGDNYEARS